MTNQNSVRAAVAAVLSIGLGAACGQAPGSGSGDGEPLGAASSQIREANLTVTTDGRDLSCPAPIFACFDVATNGANITHIFVDVDAPCAPDPEAFTVTVDGTLVEKLHHQGGPCHDIDRDVWFPLIGNQDHAHVCVSFDGFVPSSVSVGAKAKNECRAASVSATCTVCGQDAGVDAPPDGAGGSGGSAGCADP